MLNLRLRCSSLLRVMQAALVRPRVKTDSQLVTSRYSHPNSRCITHAVSTKQSTIRQRLTQKWCKELNWHFRCTFFSHLALLRAAVFFSGFVWTVHDHDKFETVSNTFCPRTLLFSNMPRCLAMGHLLAVALRLTADRRVNSH